MIFICKLWGKFNIALLYSFYVDSSYNGLMYVRVAIALNDINFWDFEGISLFSKHENLNMSKPVDVFFSGWAAGSIGFLNYILHPVQKECSV